MSPALRVLLVAVALALPLAAHAESASPRQPEFAATVEGGAITQKAPRPAKGETKGDPSEATPAPAEPTPIDLNSASESELKQLPGIGDVYAAKIIATRPFANKAQLVAKKILTKAEYEKMKDLVVAKKPAVEAPPAAK